MNTSVLLISEQTLKQNTLINLNIDNKLLTSNIIEVQNIYLLPLLGTGLYNEIVNQISSSTLSTVNQFLIDNYIQPYLSNQVLAESLPFINYQIRNGSVNKLQGETFVATELKELQYLIDKIKDKSEWYGTRLIEYLKANSSTYPLYDSPGTSTDTIYPNHSNDFDSGMFIPRKYKTRKNNIGGDCFPSCEN